jgi:hypothetical protein
VGVEPRSGGIPPRLWRLIFLPPTLGRCTISGSGADRSLFGIAYSECLADGRMRRRSQLSSVDHRRVRSCSKLLIPRALTWVNVQGWIPTAMPPGVPNVVPLLPFHLIYDAAPDWSSSRRWRGSAKAPEPAEGALEQDAVATRGRKPARCRRRLRRRRRRRCRPRQLR